MKETEQTPIMDLVIYFRKYDEAAYPSEAYDAAIEKGCAIERAANALAEAIRRDDQVLMAEALADFDALKPTTQPLIK